MAIDPSAAFRKALREHLPRAAVSVDAFHLVRAAGDMLTTVRQRRAREHKGRRGRLVDPAGANRRLLLRAGDKLTPAAWARLETIFRTDDPTDEPGAAWGVKEQVRTLLATSSLAHARKAKMLLGYYAALADMAETDKLWDTINNWWEFFAVRRGGTLI